MELIVEHSPQILAREEKATTTTYLGVIYIYISVRNGRGRRFLAWVSMARSVRDLVYHVLADHKTQVTDYKSGRIRDSLLVRAPDSRLKGREFESQQERQENFLLQSQLCVLTLIRCLFHPPVTAVACKITRSF